MDTPQIISQPAPVASPLVTSKRPKPLMILGIVAATLFTIALGIVIFGKKGDSTAPTASTQTARSVEEQVVGWPKYSNTQYFYELSVPPKWSEITHSPLHSELTLFNAEDSATFELAAYKSSSTLDEFIASQDATVVSTSQVKVGQYDGYERAESYPQVGLQGIATYIKISDMLYIFTLTPASGKTALTNESILRDYHAALASFRLTDTSQLGKDLKEYVSRKVESLPFQAFSLRYPQTWILKEQASDNSLEISIYRNNYELTISQKTIGNSICLFSDSPAFEGSSGDLRNKQFTEFNTLSSATLRRYFNANFGDKSSMFFCQKQAEGPYFQTPLNIGGLVYNVPAKYDPNIILEMDEIVKSIVPTPWKSSIFLLFLQLLFW